MEFRKDYQKTGYLKEDFRYFHLHTETQQEFPYHYHDFHKMLFFLKGDVTYHIEGRSFDLTAGDIVLIPAGEIHKPVLNSNSSYERRILYLSPGFLRFGCGRTENLSLCFENAGNTQANVVQVPPVFQKRIGNLCTLLEEELNSTDSFAGELYGHTLVTELLILLNRASLNQHSVYPENTCKDEKVLLILEYINSHLTDSLSIDTIASHFFISRYHLMHLFKNATGYTVGNYINIKRLLYARSLIQNGVPVTQACYLSGFQNYSTFSRAYKKQFHVSAGKD